LRELWEKIKEALVSALPITRIVYLMALGLIVVFFLLCRFLFLKLPKRQLLKIGVGVLFTYAGLVQIPKETEEEK